MATIQLNLTAVDKASPVLGKLADAGKKLGTGLALAGGIAAGAAIQFGADSVKAYAESQVAQGRLADAYARFPKILDVNIESMRKLNEERAKVTRYDDDITASSQAVLAQFELTGEQIMQLTPLMQDYAAKTGKDLPTAAEDLGKAMLGQGRALKDIGVDFEDTGTLAGNFDGVIAALSEKVVGFAEVDAETAAGKLEVLRNRFGEVQEKIGGALMPALQALVDWLDGDGMEVIEGLGTWIADEAIPSAEKLVGWIVKWKDELGLLAGAIVIAIGLQWALNAATAANPWGAVIAALVAVVAWIGYVMANFDMMRDKVLDAADSILLGMIGIGRGFNGLVEGLINGIIDLINMSIDRLNVVLGFLGMGKIGQVGYFKIDTSFGDGLERQLRANQAYGTGRASTAKAPAGIGTGARSIRALAEGGIVSSAMIALIGEGTEPEAVVPLSKAREFARDMGVDGGAGAGEVVVEIHGRGVALEQLIDVRIRNADDADQLNSKMGRQRR